MVAPLEELTHKSLHYKITHMKLWVPAGKKYLYLYNLNENIYQVFKIIAHFSYNFSFFVGQTENLRRAIFIYPVVCYRQTP